MITTPRFNKAIEKLYQAFHNDELNPLCNKQCAVGNICDNQEAWRYFAHKHGSTQLSYVGFVNDRLGKRINGYSPSELIQIEAVFLQSLGLKPPFEGGLKKNSISKDLLFQGLEATVALLCKMDGLPNVMDCHRLFEYQLAIPEDERILI